jgi:hypothetical protein
VVQELAAANSPLASVGGLIGYLPHAPQADPIAKPVCVSVPPVVRDLLVRCIPDSPDRLAMLRRALGQRVLTAGAAEVAGALDGSCGGVEHVIVHAGISVGESALEGLLRPASRVAVTIIDGGDSFIEGLRLVQACRGVGCAGVHLRTPLIDGVAAAREILLAGVDVISIDVLAENSGTYGQLTGRGCFDRVREGVAFLLEQRRIVHGIPTMWVVPRITRRDTVYEQVEGFYTRGLVTADWCVIDPSPESIPGDRIEPLPVPSNVRDRLQWSTRVIDAEGFVRDGRGALISGAKHAVEVG